MFVLLSVPTSDFFLEPRHGELPRMPTNQESGAFGVRWCQVGVKPPRFHAIDRQNACKIALNQSGTPYEQARLPQTHSRAYRLAGPNFYTPLAASLMRNGHPVVVMCVCLGPHVVATTPP